MSDDHCAKLLNAVNADCRSATMLATICSLEVCGCMLFLCSFIGICVISSVVMLFHRRTSFVSMIRASLGMLSPCFARDIGTVIA